MKYLCLVYNEEASVEALPESDYDAIVAETFGYRETLRANGHYIASSPLQPVRTAKTLRTRNGMPVVTDGPFAETKEQLGGFYLIEAEDMDEAVRLATKMPPARLGCIEVRALRGLEERPGRSG